MCRHNSQDKSIIVKKPASDVLVRLPHKRKRVVPLTVEQARHNSYLKILTNYGHGEYGVYTVVLAEPPQIVLFVLPSHMVSIIVGVTTLLPAVCPSSGKTTLLHDFLPLPLTFTLILLSLPCFCD